MHSSPKETWEETRIELDYVGDPATGRDAASFLANDWSEGDVNNNSTRWRLPHARTGTWQQGYAKLKSGIPAVKHDHAFRGWRRTMMLVVGLASAVLVTNLGLAIASTRLPNDNGVGLVLEGHCRSVSRWDTGLHLLINVLGTLLLGASNFTMQCLNAPSRGDVDIAHRKGISLDIGVSSAKNLRYLRKFKGFLWCMLALSTLPLHLLSVTL